MKSLGNTKPEREHTIHTVANDVVSKEQPEKFKQVPVAHSTSDQIGVRDAITGIPSHVEEAIANPVFGTTMAQHKGVENRLSPTLESLV